QMEGVALLSAELCRLPVAGSLQGGPERNQISLFRREGASENAKVCNRSAVKVTASVASNAQGRVGPDVTREGQALIPTLSRNSLTVEIKSHARLFAAAVIRHDQVVPRTHLQLLGKAGSDLD